MKTDLDKGPFQRSWVPEPILPAEPALLDLYWLAWESAWRHVKGCEGAPQPRFMDEGFSPRTIWIWDTCFMVHFSKYAPDHFPGIESLNNFYAPMVDGVTSPLRIHHPDNPPLFAWSEWAHWKHTGDQHRLESLIHKPGYLLHLFEFIEASVPGTLHPFANCPVTAQRDPLGYRWKGVQSGMDNTPRGRDQHESIYWLDLAAQQALSAHCIAEMADLLDDAPLAQTFRAKHTALIDLLNQHYWDEKDGGYYDISIAPPHEPVRVRTPASFWPLLAGAADQAQADRLAAWAKDPNTFGGTAPWPSVEPTDPAFSADGTYWRGGIWLPTAYMATKALTQYGHHDVAADLALKLIRHQRRTWDEFEPASIWECYSPTEARPGTNPVGELCRADFCGWSALGPISLLLENVLGVHEVDALQGRIDWHIIRSDRHGVRGLRVGETIVDLIAEPTHLDVRASNPCTLCVNGQLHALPAGPHRLPHPLVR